MAKKNKWFEVDKEGLASILERRGGKAFLLYELFQNCWDQNAKQVSMKLTPVAGRPYVHLVVEDDDPDGFKNLRHAFTLFADSEKKSDPRKRGRFNLGEKLVLSLCESAHIITTTGAIRFHSDGTREPMRERREKGSLFGAELRMTCEEYHEASEAVERLIPPPGILTYFNGEQLTQRDRVLEFEVVLPTEVSDPDGRLRRTARKTEVWLYDPLENETAFIYEMGIPVVETGDKFHVDVQQKVPLTLDRDNVPPSYLRTLRAVVLNHTYRTLSDADANLAWIREAAGHKDVSEEALKKSLEVRFGQDYVIYDPSDPEANKLAVSKGYKVIHGGSLTSEEWENVKRTNAALPAGQVTPSPKPYTPGGSNLKLIDRSEWTEGMHKVAGLANRLAERLLGLSSIEVKIAREFDWQAAATYGRGGPLVFNLGALGPAFFNDYPSNLEQVVDLMIHEFGHQYSGDHLSSEYHDALTRLGGRAVKLALEEPNVYSVENSSVVVRRGG